MLNDGVVIGNQVRLRWLFLSNKGWRKSAASLTHEGCPFSAAASWIWISDILHNANVNAFVCVCF